MKKICIVLLCIFLFKIGRVYAVTTSILSVPSDITTDPFTVVASISGNISGTNYLRIDLFKENTTNYFGQTYNGSSWYGGSDGMQYFPITVTDGIWSGSLQGRVSNPSLTEYSGPGSYRMRVRRYTSSGNAGSSDEQTVSVNITVNLPTSTPIPTSSPSNTPTPTNSPTQTKTPTPKPTIKNNPSPTRTFITTKTEVSNNGTVLGQEATQTPTPTTMVKSQSNLIGGAKVALVLGLLFCGIAIMIFTQRIQNIKK